MGSFHLSSLIIVTYNTYSTLYKQPSKTDLLVQLIPWPFTSAVKSRMLHNGLYDKDWFVFHFSYPCFLHLSKQILPSWFKSKQFKLLAHFQVRVYLLLHGTRTRWYSELTNKPTLWSEVGSVVTAFAKSWDISPALAIPHFVAIFTLKSLKLMKQWWTMAQ